jgi:hypothetical protein
MFANTAHEGGEDGRRGLVISVQWYVINMLMPVN